MHLLLPDIDVCSAVANVEPCRHMCMVSYKQKYFESAEERVEPDKLKALF